MKKGRPFEFVPPISAIGEKATIRDFIKSLFNVADGPRGVGGDCAANWNAAVLPMRLVWRRDFIPLMH